MRLNYFLLPLLLIGSFQFLHAQEAQTITLKKGEVLDILLLRQRPDTKADLQDYFKVAFPVANKMSYTPLPGFAITGNVAGNILPESLILGKWDNIVLREQFLTDILDEVPDFHARRRAIWSYFGLTYFELPEDVTFQTKPEKVRFASAFWLDQSDDRTLKTILDELADQGGRSLITLRDGHSPLGYLYDPTFVLLTEWDTAADFERFQAAIRALTKDRLFHINEFSLK